MSEGIADVDVWEIEITPEMAGVIEFYQHDDRFEPPEIAVIKIFRAMVMRIPSRPPESVVLGVEAACAWSPYL